MFKKITALILSIAAALCLSSCGGGKTAGSDGDKLPVSVTFNAIAELVQAVGGNKVAVSTIIPDGTEPHDFEPTADKLVELSSARVFVYNGLGMEAWADKAISASENKELIAVNASDGITPITNSEEKETSEHGQYDPHIWLSLQCAEIMAENIRDALVKADPDNGDYYKSNCSDYTAQLQKLYSDYSAKFQDTANKNIVTGHAAFAYLCRDFGLVQNSVEDVFAEGEPTGGQLAELVDYCKANKVTTIFAEKLASPEISQTLADEVKAKVVTIYTIESKEDDMTYLERMESNLSHIYDSLTD